MNKLIVFLRHGARLPLIVDDKIQDCIRASVSFKYLEENIPKFLSNPSDKTLLTDKGFQQAMHSGRLVGRQYRDFINTMAPADVSVRSTNYQRSYYSANAFYRGVLQGADVKGDLQ